MMHTKHLDAGSMGNIRDGMRNMGDSLLKSEA
jgi:hypothetical protein